MLLDRAGLKADLYSRAADPTGSHVLVPFAGLPEVLAARAGNRGIGVEIANTVKPADLLPHLDSLALVAIAFPSFSDGRGFSIAKSLRNAGYRGILRAVGPLIADQFAYALACGFDEVELPAESAARQPVEIWLAAARAFRATYQRSHAPAGTSILDRRQAARLGAPELGAAE
jgi:uncharacterized protein (DUF934 family)